MIWNELTLITTTFYHNTQYIDITMSIQNSIRFRIVLDSEYIWSPVLIFVVQNISEYDPVHIITCRHGSEEHHDLCLRQGNFFYQDLKHIRMAHCYNRGCQNDITSVCCKLLYFRWFTNNVPGISKKSSHYTAPSTVCSSHPCTLFYYTLFYYTLFLWLITQSGHIKIRTFKQ